MIRTNPKVKIRDLSQKIDRFTTRIGRRPRVLLIQSDNDINDLQKVAAGLVESGIDVDIGPGLLEPKSTARVAVENDVHAIHLSGIKTCRKAAVAELRTELAALGAHEILVFTEKKLSYAGLIAEILDHY